MSESLDQVRTDGEQLQAAEDRGVPGALAPGEEALRREDVLGALQSLMVVVVVATFIVTFLVQPFRIPSESMDPTLRVGDFLLMNKQAFAERGPLDFLMPPTAIKRGDMMVFHYPLNPEVDFVKRVVGLPGDRLKLHDGKVYVNGKAVDEPYAYFTLAIPDTFRDDFPVIRSMDQNIDPAWWSALRRNVREGELYVPAGRYFVMGDNRNDSEDSRYWGFVTRAAVVGRPMLVYFSVGREHDSMTLRERAARVFRSARLVK